MKRKKIMLFLLMSSFVVMIFQVMEVKEGAFLDYFGPILQFVLMIALYIAVLKEK